MAEKIDKDDVSASQELSLAKAVFQQFMERLPATDPLRKFLGAFDDIVMAKVPDLDAESIRTSVANFIGYLQTVFSDRPEIHTLVAAAQSISKSVVRAEEVLNEDKVAGDNIRRIVWMRGYNLGLSLPATELLELPKLHENKNDWFITGSAKIKKELQGLYDDWKKTNLPESVRFNLKISGSQDGRDRISGTINCYDNGFQLIVRLPFESKAPDYAEKFPKRDNVVNRFRMNIAFVGQEIEDLNGDFDDASGEWIPLSQLPGIKELDSQNFVHFSGWSKYFYPYDFSSSNIRQGGDPNDDLPIDPMELGLLNKHLSYEQIVSIIRHILEQAK